MKTRSQLSLSQKSARVAFVIPSLLNALGTVIITMARIVLYLSGEMLSSVERYAPNPSAKTEIARGGSREAEEYAGYET